MQNQKTDFAKIFLLEFTKQLIENSKPKGIVEIEQKEKIEEPEEIKHLETLEKIPKRKNIIKNIIKRKKSVIQKIIPRPIPPQNIPIKKPILKQLPRKLIIPGQRLPPRFQNIKPAPTKREIDLGKLNPIIEDPTVNSLECDGPNIPIKINTKMGQKRNTKITLTKEEINAIISTFSKVTRIPALEGIYKVAAGNLILLSVISEIIGAKFVIKKIPQSPQGIPPRGMPPQRMIRR